MRNQKNKQQLLNIIKSLMIIRFNFKILEPTKYRNIATKVLYINSVGLYTP